MPIITARITIAVEDDTPHDETVARIVHHLFAQGTIRDAFSSADPGLTITATSVYAADIVSVAEDLASLLEEVDNGMTGSWLNERDVLLKRLRALTNDAEPTP